MNRHPTTPVEPVRTSHDSIGAAAISHSNSRARTWTWVRLGIGVVVLVLLSAKVGSGPFLDGLRLTSIGPLVLATAVTALTTACCAWRWRLVAESLGVRLSTGAAMTAVYRSQFLNATLPGGVLGDVDRAVTHGRTTGAVSAGVRSVVWERTLGQAVQVLVTIVLVVAVPSPMRPLGIALAAAVAICIAAALISPASASNRLAARVLRAASDDLRCILRAPRLVGAIALTSTLAVAGHLAVFVVAMRATGADVTATNVLPLAAIVLLASAVPTNIAGWGPREGVAGWAFGVAGLGVGAGVTTAVVYGVMALVATLPGAVVLIAESGRSWSRTAIHPPHPVLQEAASA